jgi:hypothetical protein
MTPFFLEYLLSIENIPMLVFAISGNLVVLKKYYFITTITYVGSINENTQRITEVL